MSTAKEQIAALVQQLPDCRGCVKPLETARDLYQRPDLGELVRTTFR